MMNLQDLARAAEEREKLKLSQRFGNEEPGGQQRGNWKKIRIGKEADELSLKHTEL